jgi:hypothetical protein
MFGRMLLHFFFKRSEEKRSLSPAGGGVGGGRDAIRIEYQRDESDEPISQRTIKLIQ